MFRKAAKVFDTSWLRNVQPKSRFSRISGFGLKLMNDSRMRGCCVRAGVHSLCLSRRHHGKVLYICCTSVTSARFHYVPVQAAGFESALSFVQS